MDNSKENLIIAKPSVRQLQEGQHYQLVDNPACAASYSCSFTWKINQVQENRMSTLYSKPFYTEKNGSGYKMRLLLFMDGDGSGEGTHISFYAALMRGEHDARLQWPFRQRVKLVLVSQDQRKKDITQCFQPDPVEFDGSFWQPSLHCEMNVGFGYPEFSPLSVLDDPTYVRNDTMILKCIIEN
jgi:hypothetical protein